MTSTSLERFAERKLATLERRALRRDLVLTDRFTAVRSRRERTELVSVSCNDYLGLTHHPDVIAAHLDATRRYGTGAGASRLVTGNHPLYEELESRLSALKGSEDAAVFGSGYLASMGVIPALVGPPDLILLDELCHSCLRAGAALSGAQVIEFRHNDPVHVRELLERQRPERRYCLLVTEGVFSMDGDLAPLPALAALARDYDAWLATDDAHALGVVGGGRGSSFAFGESGGPVEVDVQIGTLSKAAGSYGGYVCTSRAVTELIRNRARSFVYSTGLPPGSVAAASKALEIIATDAGLVERPLTRAQLFTEALGLPPAQSAIVPWVMGEPEAALDASRALAEAGFLVVAIRPPTVPAGTARLRFAFSALHSQSDVFRLAESVAELPRAA